jgi:peptidoglycan/xylan/chitin deacetylase (PgdA/CDA1 family)
MRSRDRVAGALGATAAAAHLLPSVAAIGPLRTRVLPGLCGQSHSPHIALTFDDGPDPESTPRILDALAGLGVRATFFVLGARLARSPELGLRIVAQNHEVAVHGWTHRPHLLRSPLAIGTDLRRTVEVVTATTGRRPRYWRPPHGIPTGAGLLAARRQALRPVLWTADGRDWQASATAASIRDRITSQLAPGGVVLLHDSDALSAPGSWRHVLDALPGLAGFCSDRGWDLGPLGEHDLGGPRHAL